MLTEPKHIGQTVVRIYREILQIRTVYGALLRIAGQNVRFTSDGKKGVIQAPPEALTRIYNALPHFQNLLSYVMTPERKTMLVFPLREDLIKELLEEENKAA